MGTHSHDVADIPLTVVLTDGSRALTGRLQGVTPVNGSDLATKDYVDSNASGNASQVQGVDWASDTPTDGQVPVYDSARGEWVPGDAPNVGASGIHGIPLDETWHATGGNAMTLDAAGAAGRQRTISADNTAGAGGAYTTEIQKLVHLPHDYTPGSTIAIRVRGKYTLAAQVSTTVDLAAYAQEGKFEGGADICATAAQALSSAYADYDFTITNTDLGPGDALVIVLRFTSDDTGGSNNAAAVFGALWLGIGTLAWKVGATSLVGSAKVG